MYHPYKNGYSVLPALEKLEEDPFDKDDLYSYYLSEKRKALKYQRVLLYHGINYGILDAFSNFIIEHGPSWVKPPFTLSNVAMQVQEDIAIHRIKDGKDWLAATHICFPSSWEPIDKIGKPLSEIHKPIPGMNLNNNYKLAEMACDKGPFRRFVWSPIYERKINYHPKNEKKKFDKDNPFILVKVEKQITYPLPKVDAFVFILRQYLVEPNLLYLLNACKSMTEEQKRYKDIGPELIEYLEYYCGDKL